MKLATCSIVFGLGWTAWAQSPAEVRIRSGPYAPPGAVISVDTNLVEMTATVHGPDGQLVSGLKRDDFELLENGKPRTITLFAEQRAAAPAAPGVAPATAGAEQSAGASGPRAIALLFDDTHIGTYGLSQAKIAAHKLVETGMHAEDRVAIFTDSGEVELDLTADRKALGAAIDKVKTHPLRGAMGIAVCPTLTPYQAYVIASHLDPFALDIAVAEKIACDCPPDDDDCPKRQPPAVQALATDQWAVFQHQSTIPLDVMRVVVRGLSHAPGQRILLLISPGFVTGGMERETAAIADEAVRAQVVINTLDAEGLPGEGESTDAKAPGHAAWAERTQGLRQTILSRLLADSASATGGAFVHNTNDLQGAFDNLTRRPEVAYLIGFTPPGEPDEKYHSMSLRVRKSGFQVQSRPGYFAARPGNRNADAQVLIDRVAEANSTLNPFPAIVRVSEPESSIVRVDIAIDAKRLKFARKQGREIQEITFVTMLEDSAGNFVAGKQAVMDFAVTGPTLSKLQAEGIHVNTTFTVPKGSYRVREVVREAVENRVAASNTPFEAQTPQPDPVIPATRLP